MPLAIAFAEPDTFLLHAAERVTYVEIQRGIDDILAHPAIERATRIQVDARKVTGAPSTAELRAVAAELKPLRDRGLDTIAIVSATTFVYGVARMFGVFAEVFGIHVRAFRTVDEAEEWLRSTRIPTGDAG